MCVSVTPGEFNATVIANYPESTGDESQRVLSYMNSAQSYGTSASFGIADTGPNAMIFPVYGEVTDIAACPDPEASREWLAAQKGVYQEIWDDGLPKMLGGGSYGMPEIQTAGNYLVGVAADVDSIPSTLHALKQATPRPENVPVAPDHILEMMNTFYRAQDLGVPQFVVAAFALKPDQLEKKNPITLQYTQSEVVGGKLIFPALDYHGQGEFEPFVSRDHTLLMSTDELQDIFAPAMQSRSATGTPEEFANSPQQFPLGLHDKRIGQRGPAGAPNNDYMFETEPLHQALATAYNRFNEELTGDPDSSDWATRYNHSAQVGVIITDLLGRLGLMQFSNQPATTAEAYADAGDWSYTLLTDNH